MSNPDNSFTQRQKNFLRRGGLRFASSSTRSRDAVRASFSTAQVKAIKNISKKQITRTSETKYLSYQSNNTYEIAGTFIPLANIAAGTGSSNRVGSKITLTKLSGRFQCLKADSFNQLRIVIGLYESNVMPNNANQIFATTSDYVGVSEYLPGDSRDVKFKIYYDRLVKVDIDKAVSNIVKFNIDFTKKNLDLKYDGPNATDYANGTLFAYIWSDSGAVTHPSVRWRSVLHWIDP